MCVCVCVCDCLCVCVCVCVCDCVCVWYVCVCVCVVQAYTLEGDQVQQGRFYSCKKDRSSGVLQANVEGDIK